MTFLEVFFLIYCSIEPNIKDIYGNILPMFLMDSASRNCNFYFSVYMALGFLLDNCQYD